MNKITLIGNLTRDPELRTTPSGVTMCTFGIAVNRRFAQQNGEKITDFFNVVTWRQQAEICSKYLSKGKKVAVVGELQARTYEGKDGKTHMSLEVSAEEVEFLSPRQQDSDSSSQERYSPSTNNNSGNVSEGFVDVDDDELPF